MEAKSALTQLLATAGELNYRERKKLVDRNCEKLCYSFVISFLRADRPKEL